MVIIIFHYVALMIEINVIKKYLVILQHSAAELLRETGKSYHSDVKEGEQKCEEIISLRMAGLWRIQLSSCFSFELPFSYSLAQGFMDCN